MQVEQTSSPNRILAWVFGLPWLVVFVGILVVFHLPALFSYYLFGDKALARTLHSMTWFIINSLRLVGTRIRLENQCEPDPEIPLIVVSNHQSFFDVPMMYLLLKRHIPKFVTKKELAKWIPTVSFNIRKGGSVIINRSDGRAAIQRIVDWAPSIAAGKHAAVVFPEGTRSRDGLLRPFKPAGAAALIKSMPNALVVPVAITGSWELLKWKLFPIPLGVRFHATVLNPIDPKGQDEKEVIQQCEEAIRNQIGQANLKGEVQAIQPSKAWI